MSEFLLGVGSSLVASVIFVAIARKQNWIVFGKARRSWQLARRLDEIGMTNFFASRADYARYRPSGHLADYLDTATYRIDIAGYWMGHGNETEAIAKRIVQSLNKKPGMTVRIALIDPNGPHVQAVASYLGIADAELRDRLEASLNNLAHERQGATESVRNRFSILTYAEMPLASVIILDYGATSARVQLDFKPFRRPRSESFSFEITAPSALYETCASAWIAIVDSAAPYEPPS